MREPLHPAAPESDKSPHERFKELGKRLMAVTKLELDEQERDWQQERDDKPRRKSR